MRKKQVVTVPTGYKAVLVRESPGRPRLYPEGSRPRSFRLTDQEYDLVKAFVKKIRKETAAKTA